MSELKELRSREPSGYTTQSIISLLMGMKFFRIKMVPIEEFEASFQFMQECANYFLEVKDKDIKHALAGLFVEILVPVAAAVKNEVNVPCLKNFVDMLYSQTLDLCTKKKHSLALFPLVTCLLCVSQKTFFLMNWHCFLAMCLSHLKHRDPKMCRVALESLYRLLWVYMIRIKCESNTATQTRLQSIVNSLFPKGSKAVVPRETPLNIFVKIIQFIAQERLDFAMKEIVFDLISVGRPIKIILTPERMAIGLRAFLVVADSLQQREGYPPMPRTVGVLPSGSTLRVKKTFINKALTEDTAKSIGMSQYYYYVRKAFDDILRALDAQFGKPLMMTSTQNSNKEAEEMITAERKPKIDLFRTCVAAVPRLIPDGMRKQDLVDLLARLTVHIDEELRGLAYQSLQNMISDLPEWREDVIQGFIQFALRDIGDLGQPHLMDQALKMLLQLLTAWKNSNPKSRDVSEMRMDAIATVLHQVEGLCLAMLCQNRLTQRRVAVHLLKETKGLIRTLLPPPPRSDPPVIDIIESALPEVVERCLRHPQLQLPVSERMALLTAQQSQQVDLQWLTERNNPIWTGNPTMAEAEASKGNTNTAGSSSSSNVFQDLSKMDAWCLSMMTFIPGVVKHCPTAVTMSWPIVTNRINALFSHFEMSLINDNRASLLRTNTVKKTTSERDAQLTLWRNYILFACRVAPSNPNVIMRYLSPDLSFSSSPENLPAGRDESRISNSGISATNLFKQLVPLLRSEQSDMRSAVVLALAQVNATALKDLVEELAAHVREAVDRKQENLRRRRRRDILRVHLTKLLEKLAGEGTLALASCVRDKETGALSPVFQEYIDGVRLLLESEAADKDSASMATELKHHFCSLLVKLIKSFNIEQRSALLSLELRRKLFYLFANWCGYLGTPFSERNDNVMDYDMTHLQAMCTVLGCGPMFEPPGVHEESVIYNWLDGLLSSKDEKLNQIGLETVVLLLENNQDTVNVLEWLVDRCYTGQVKLADSCFKALVTVFSSRDYPCDHYISIINVALLNSGSSRAHNQEIALQLLHVLDNRFFRSPSMCESFEEPSTPDGRKKSVKDEERKRSPLLPRSEEPISSSPSSQSSGSPGRTSPRSEKGQPNVWFRDEMKKPLLPPGFSPSQLFLSRQISRLHPELTMPMFSEVTSRFQTARPAVRANMLHYLLPWLHNMELVDPNILRVQEQSYPAGKEGWGTAEATEMVLNNLFYITVKYGDEHAKEIEELWAALGLCWPNNLRVIIRYLFIMITLSPGTLLHICKRIVLYMARTAPEGLIDELMAELQVVETLNAHVERIEATPFYRLTRKGSSNNSEEEKRIEQEQERGTIHTKRRSAEDGSDGSVSSVKSLNRVDQEQGENNFILLCRMADEGKTPKDPHPLPMPEYGGYYAPLAQELPVTSVFPNCGFHRCNMAVILLTDIVTSGISIDWSPHIPLMLHLAFLGLDNGKQLVYEHCRKLLLNLLIAVAQHNDDYTISRILLNAATQQLNFGLPGQLFTTIKYNFTDPQKTALSTSTTLVNNPTCTTEAFVSVRVKLGKSENEEVTTEDVTKCLVDFLACKFEGSLWACEDITAKVWNVKSTEQLSTFLQHVLFVFKESLPSARIEERWAQCSLQMALSCSSRHYAGRSLQIFRALGVPLNNRMLMDILSRLVETVSEQGEDMQGYVTELMLTLEAAVDALDANIKISDLMKEIFKPIPPHNRKHHSAVMYSSLHRQHSHARSTSYSAHGSVQQKKPAAVVVSGGGSGGGGGESPVPKTGRPQVPAEDELSRSQSIQPQQQQQQQLGRSRSALSLKVGEEVTQEDKTNLLLQMFWIAVSVLDSDYEHEFLLALRLLEKVLLKLPLKSTECVEKLDKIRSQMKWTNFPGVHNILLKGCTSPTAFDSTVNVLCLLTNHLDIAVVDCSQNSLGFPLHVIALLPYFLANYDDANAECIRAAENIAQVCVEQGPQLENLATVMTLYSQRSFSKESLQWCKCIVKYLYDAYHDVFLHLLGFLVEMLEKGPNYLVPHVLTVLYCILLYLDISGPTTATCINNDLLKTMARYIEGNSWKDALRVIKHVVTRCSVLPPNATGVPQATHPAPHASDAVSLASSASEVADSVNSGKRELPGRTMDFSFDMNCVPYVGLKSASPMTPTPTPAPSGQTSSSNNSTLAAPSPRRSLSHGASFNNESFGGWKRPWLSQPKTREHLISVLSSCGQRVTALPKSPSVIFSHTSDSHHQSMSMCSSTEEVSVNAGQGEHHSSADMDTNNEFGVFKDFDFLEYELESQEGETMDNFNWGVRRRSLSNFEVEDGNYPGTSGAQSNYNTLVPQKEKKTKQDNNSSSDDGSVSPFYDHSDVPSISLVFPNRPSPSRISGSSQSLISEGDCTLSNTSPTFSPVLAHGGHGCPPYLDECENLWRSNVRQLMTAATEASAGANVYRTLGRLLKQCFRKVTELTRECCNHLNNSDNFKKITTNFTSILDVLANQAEPPFIHIDPELLSSSRSLERLKFLVLEVQEHFETFLEKREHNLEYMDALRSAMKLESIGEEISEEMLDETKLDLCRGLYKLHFQALLLVDSYNKVLSHLTNSINHTQIVDLSEEVSAVKAEIIRAVEDTESDRLSPPVPIEVHLLSQPEAENVLIELIMQHKWNKVTKHLHTYRQLFPSLQLGSTEDDDMDVVLKIYCKQLCEHRSGYFVMTRPDYDMTDVCHKLRDLNLQLSSTLHVLETSATEGNATSSPIQTPQKSPPRPTS
ncbi:protein furry [Galendromus occidentalis]|uniref:Protein furry n=1 Tax=Galendromus occidentalis TaxID=34638 RepID=A0AAJ7WJ26_9ACAR|nr:protein furry [Galendromus occidentalis]